MGEREAKGPGDKKTELGRMRDASRGKREDCRE